MSSRRASFLLSAAFVVLACKGGDQGSATAAKPAPPPTPAAAAKATPATPVPLLDRALFFADPETSAAQLSPDGEMITFIRPYRGVRNVWVKKRDEPLSAARPLTADARPVPAYFWSYDNRHVLYVQDKGGNENYRVYAVDTSGKPDEASGVPASRDLTVKDGVRAQILSLTKSKPGVIAVGLNDRDAAFHDAYTVDIATGKRKLLYKNTTKLGGYAFDIEGNLRLGFRQTADGGNEILRIEGSKLTPIYECSAAETCGVARFHKDGKRAYLTSNKGEPDLIELSLIDVATGAIERLEADPEGKVDFEDAEFGEDTDELVATVYVGDRTRIYPKDPAYAADLDKLGKELGDGELSRISSSTDMRWHLYDLHSDVNPGQVFLYDRQTGKADKLYDLRPDLPSEQLATMKPIVYKSRDGLEIPAYLTLPKGVPAEKLPLVLHPHGGPWARDFWGYSGFPQFLANRGYAVLQPNFRSSLGYGEKFRNAGNKEWGTGAMQHDLTDGVKHLIAQGIVDEKRVAIFGGSYGGYATLAGVSFTPELYAAGVPYVAPSNLVTLVESFPPYWRPFLKGTWFVRVGDPADPKDREDLLARSPLFSVDKIRVPLLVVHGANDPRVKQTESDAIVAALRDKGQAVEYIVAKDEGHGFRSPENRMALAVAMERFLAKHIGGREQKEVPPDVEKHLGELTVDVAKVTAPATAAATPTPAPAKPAGTVEPAAAKGG